MTGPDVTGTEEYAEKAARDAVALRVEERTLALADELCADHRADHPLDHCQECYDLACTVSDSSWLAASLEAARVEERARIAQEITDYCDELAGPPQFWHEHIRDLRALVAEERTT